MLWDYRRLKAESWLEVWLREHGGYFHGFVKKKRLWLLSRHFLFIFFKKSLQKRCNKLSKWHLIFADLLSVKPQTWPWNIRALATRLLQHLRYALIKTQGQRKIKRENVVSPCFIFRRRECLDTRVSHHTSLDFEGGNKSASALFTHN